MKHMFILISLALTLVACQGSTGGTGVPGPQGPAGPGAQPAQPTPSDNVINGYNAYLVSQGSDPLTPGLKCTLYTIPNMPATPCIVATDIVGCTAISSTVGYASVGSFTYTGTIDQTNQSGTMGFNLLPIELQPLYTSNFAVTCTGYIVNTDYNYHSFSISSDDGSLLYVGGSLVVSNDGEHSIATMSGEKYLEAEVYSFQLNYFQGPGNLALVVNMDGSILPAAALYH
jgi:PA14 domain